MRHELKAVLAAALLWGCPKADAPAPARSPGRYCFFVAPALLEVKVELRLEASGRVEGTLRRVIIDESEETRVEEVFPFRGRLVGERLEVSGPGPGDAPRVERWPWRDGGLVTPLELIAPAACPAP